MDWPLRIFGRVFGVEAGDHDEAYRRRPIFRVASTYPNIAVPRFDGVLSTVGSGQKEVCLGETMTGSVAPFTSRER